MGFVYMCFLWFFSLVFFSYSGLFGFFCLPVCFLSKEREIKEVELARWRGGEDLRGVGGGRTLSRLLY